VDLSKMKSKLQATSRHAFEKLSGIKGIKPIRANAAMYMMVKLDLKVFKDIDDDVEFCQKLLHD
jgi:aspartate/methionine/tyrosine aminotransferase